MFNINLTIPLKKNFLYKYKNSNDEFPCKVIEFIYTGNKLPIKDKYDMVKIINLQNNQEYIVAPNTILATWIDNS